MDISPLQRRVTFGLIVLVLVGLGIYLLGPKPGQAAPSPPRRAASNSRPPATTAPVPSASVPPASSASSGPDSADIYQWLPFTPAGLAAAAAVARRFAADYGTFSYTQSATAYVAPLRPLSAASLVGQIEAAYSLPGVASARTTSKQVSAGVAVIQSIRAFGSSSITFLVELTEHQTATNGSSTVPASYAVTLTGSGSAWQVTDIELAGLGNS
jgi:hypothetical protein